MPMSYTNSFQSFGQPASGPSSQIPIPPSYSNLNQYPSSSASSSSSMPYPQPLPLPDPPQAYSNWSSSSSCPNEYVTNSQSAWMNWSALPPLPPQPQPAESSTSLYNTTSGYPPSTNIAYGFPPQPNDDHGDFQNSNAIASSSYGKQKEHIQHGGKDKRFDTAFAAPAINLGTGDRFSQLLEAKMSMMNGGATNDVAGGSDQMPGPPQMYEYRPQGYPIQTSATNPPSLYPPPLPPSQDMSRTSTNEYVTPNRFSEMELPLLPPPPPQPVTSGIPSVPSSVPGEGPKPKSAKHSLDKIQIPHEWMPNPGVYGIPPPPPPQEDLPSTSPKLPTSNLPTFYNQILTPTQPHQPHPHESKIPNPYPQNSPYIQQQQQQHRTNDPLAVERHLSDWSQTHIPPDLVAPLPTSMQYYGKQINPPTITGQPSQRYAQPLPPSSYNNQSSSQYSLPYPQAVPAMSQSIQPSPPATHLQTPLSASAATSVRSSRSPTDALYQRVPPVPTWVTSQPMSSNSSIAQNVEEELPPLLKIRVKDSGNSKPGEIVDEASVWTSSQPGLTKKTKKTNLPKEVSGSHSYLKEKGKKFSYSTSINKADLDINNKKGEKDISAAKTKGKGRGKGKNKKDDLEEGVDELEEEGTVQLEKHNEAKSQKKTKKKNSQKVAEVEEQEKVELANRKDKTPIQPTQLDKSLSSSTTNAAQIQKQLIDKTVIACNNCRAKKLKCNGEKPKCFHCHRRGEDTCTYEAILKRRGPGKHNKEKQPKPAKLSKKRKLAGGLDESRDHTPLGSHSGSGFGSGSNSEDESSLPIRTDNTIVVNSGIAKQIDNNRNNDIRYESFGLGGGGSEGRIKNRRLDEDEIKNMSYILNNNNNNDDDRTRSIQFDDVDVSSTTQNKHEHHNHNHSQDQGPVHMGGYNKYNNSGPMIGMGFGNNLNMNMNIGGSSIGSYGSGGSGSRFELSTARD